MLNNDYVRCPVHQTWMKKSPAANGMTFHMCNQCLRDEANKLMYKMIEEYGGDSVGRS